MLVVAAVILLRQVLQKGVAGAFGPAVVPESAWKEVRLPNSRCKVEMPGRPEPTPMAANPHILSWERHFLKLETPREEFGLAWMDLGPQLDPAHSSPNTSRRSATKCESACKPRWSRSGRLTWAPVADRSSSSSTKAVDLLSGPTWPSRQTSRPGFTFSWSRCRKELPARRIAVASSTLSRSRDWKLVPGPDNRTTQEEGKPIVTPPALAFREGWKKKTQFPLRTGRDSCMMH